MWFTDNPWPPIVLFACLAVVFFAIWTSKRRNILLVAAAAMLVLGGATYVLEKSIVTDEELVERELLQMTDAFHQHDIDGTLEFISVQAEPIRGYVRQAGDLLTEIHTLRITDVDVELLAEGSRAKTHFRANGEATAIAVGRHRFSTRWELTWQREGETWKVIDVERLDPISGETITPFSWQ
ncbi:hypothetical protein Pan258_19070 [Symmachiella dynata]|uniref:hypothetical protein n=1 Tax=Symmachiella dynata TaxID=2527995 RepID=UPI00118D2DA6|nr:hypothetical protein [Symmachiella dynata]QDT47868.1 hypothetical protein Pan258_19070 [Symmachiella dynata]